RSVGVALLAGGLLTVALLLLAAPRATRELWTSTRFRSAPDVLTALGAFGLGFVASRAFALFVQAVFPASGQERLDYNLQITAKGPDLIVLLLAGGLLIPFVEELIFRGFGLSGYERRVRPLVAAVWTSVLFAAAHGVAAQAVAVLPLGYVIARAVQHSRSFWTGVIVHATNNLLSLGLAALLMSNPAFESMLGDSASQRVPLAGGLVALVVTALALWGAHVWLRPRVETERRPGPVWSWSLLVIVLFFLFGTFQKQLEGLVRSVTGG
ncbi:CPBP family intramembrane glutamic endopeptidase, partial [Deinococcus pimensis]|uniref:CPBP family intramembrane glutamic endopeptidase n=1 Tax=Deinococcus pimensis TaxID=309888 RepID=UPI0006948BC5